MYYHKKKNYEKEMYWFSKCELSTHDMRNSAKRKINSLGPVARIFYKKIVQLSTQLHLNQTLRKKLGNDLTEIIINYTIDD